ncbi:MAG: hypothetical protein DWI02_05425 [Planctomycetota bacterium]|nr:MAG: hypothetical protein DWI02_05425 [Planctomycetota bacterium]
MIDLGRSRKLPGTALVRKQLSDRFPRENRFVSLIHDIESSLAELLCYSDFIVFYSGVAERSSSRWSAPSRLR